MYSINLKYDLLYLQIKKNIIETINKKKELEEFVLNIKFPLIFNCFQE